jgi:cobalt-precorrin 5A hydrolase
LAEKLASRLAFTADIYAKTGRENGSNAMPYDNLGLLVEKIFRDYEAFVLIMATGIAVRVLAPHIRDKRIDPAVVVMDDSGEYAISLLSGHLGGANELAREISRTVGARAVITTATDVAHKPAADILAVKLGLAIEPFTELKTVNAALANGEKVTFFIDKTLKDTERLIQMAADNGINFADSDLLSSSDSHDVAVIITDRALAVAKPHVFLRPATLAVGVGCRRGTTSTEIDDALTIACQKIGRSKRSIALIGTTDFKKNETGLLAIAQQLKIPLRVFTNEQLKDCINRNNLKTSNFVQEKIGVGNVCEPAALLSGQAGKLLLPKTVIGRVTVAVARVEYRWSE